MKNKVIRGVLAAACVTTAVSAANVFGAGTEQSLVNEASAVTQEETEETSEAETTDENTPEMTETETPDSTVENAASDLPAAEVQSGKPEETAAASFPAGNATHGWQHRKMATADVLFEVPGQKLRQGMLYELIFLKLVTANALCSRSFSCKGRSYFCHISHDTRKPAEPYVLRVSKE